MQKKWSSGVPVNETHWARFRDIYQLSSGNEEQLWKGANPKKWAGRMVAENSILATELRKTGSLPDIDITRENLIQMVQKYRAEINSEGSLSGLAICVLAWGQMRVSNARTAFSTWGEWRGICGLLLNGEISDLEAYKKFLDLRKSQKLRGMGPAYFTKLIFFLGSGNGFIMDQWTARSVNLLFDGGPLKFTRSGYLSPNNSDIEYKWFCDRLKDIAQHLETTGEQIEKLLFSHSPHKKPRGMDVDEFRRFCAWRKYVEMHS